MGKEVLMSSHINKFSSKEEVFKVVNEHKKRGADISKIVAQDILYRGENVGKVVMKI